MIQCTVLDATPDRAYMYNSNPGETSRPRHFIIGTAATQPHGSLLRLLLRIMRGQLVAS